MATYLYITEYAALAIVTINGQTMQIPQEPPLAEQVISVTSTSTACSAFNAQTRLVRLHCDSSAPVAIRFGTSPTANVEGGSPPSQRMAENQTEYKGVPPGQSFMVAAILATQ